MTNYSALRNEMVNTQLAPRGIYDNRVLDAFRSVERHKFVPKENINSAYSDCPLPIGEGQTISQPYIVALMTQCLELKGNEKILEIGTGSGYQTAILSLLSKKVYSVERIKGLAERAGGVLKEDGFNNIEIKVGDGTIGWLENGPYDGIIVTAASPSVPENYLDQLANGGKLVIPIGGKASQILSVFEKKENKIITREVCGCVFVPLVGEKGWKEE